MFISFGDVDDMMNFIKVRLDVYDKVEISYQYDNHLWRVEFSDIIEGNKREGDPRNYESGIR